MKKQQLLLVILGSALFTSCLKDKYDFENVKIDYNPQVALPLINANLVTKDLLSDIDTTIISAGSDNVLKVVFNDTIKTISLDEFISVNDQSINDRISLPPVSMDVAPQSSSFTMAQVGPNMDALTWAGLQAASAPPGQMIQPFGPELGGVHPVSTINDFSSLTFSQGTLTMTMTNNWQIPISMKLELKSVTNNAIIDTLEFLNVAPNGGRLQLLLT